MLCRCLAGSLPKGYALHKLFGIVSRHELKAALVQQGRDGQPA